MYEAVVNALNQKEKEKEKDIDKREGEQQRPTAPPAACAPLKGAGGGMAALGAIMDDNTHDAATDEARRKFFENMKRPAWASADAAPPDAEKRSDEF